MFKTTSNIIKKKKRSKIWRDTEDNLEGIQNPKFSLKFFNQITKTNTTLLILE